RGGEQAARMADLHRHLARPDAVEDLLGQGLRHHAARRRVEHQRGGVRGGEAVLDPDQPAVCDGGNIDGDFRDHTGQDLEREPLGGQADARRYAAAASQVRRCRSRRHCGFLLFLVVVYPSRRNQAMMRLTRELVKPAAKCRIAARLPISASVGYAITAVATPRMLRPWLTTSAQVAISSPAFMPTMVAPRMRPPRVVTTLIWPLTARSAWARSFSW